jgi:uncharacterized membrane protein YfcA
MPYVFYVLIGIIGGVLSGLFGVGGGVVIVPMLVMAFGFSEHMAQGTMLATFVLPTFAFAAWKYYQAGHMNIPAAILVSLGMMIGSMLSASHVQNMPAPLLKVLFGILMVAMGVKLIFW